MKGTIRLLVYLAAILGCADATRANSSVEVQLATVQEVEVAVLVPLYEKIPGIDPKVLRTRCERRVEDSLKEAGLKVSPKASQHLTIEIQYRRDPALPGAAALVATFELSEDAHLLRAWKKTTSSPLSVISWRRTDLAISAPGNLESVLFEMIDLGVKDFHESVAEAQASRARGGSFWESE
jgi:hypothetical protein